MILGGCRPLLLLLTTVSVKFDDITDHNFIQVQCLICIPLFILFFFIFLFCHILQSRIVLGDSYMKIIRFSVLIALFHSHILPSRIFL